MAVLNLLDPDRMAMIAKGVSAIVASCSADMRPSIMRAIGTHVSSDGQQLTVYLRRSQSACVLNDIADNGQLAVVFSEPATHRTLQLKGHALNVRPATLNDAPLLAAYRASMEIEVGRVGFGPVYVAAMLAGPIEDVVAVAFQPTQAFDQTPGPKAGEALPPIGGTTTGAARA